MSSMDGYMLKKSSKALKVDLVKTFGKYGVWIDITDSKFQDPWLIFTLALKKNTREKQVWDLAPDVKNRLKIHRLIVYKQEHKLLIAITNRNIEYYHLPVILKEYYTKLGQLNLPYPIGFDISMEPFMIDLSQSPHMLMGGATGSGKSVGLQMFIASVAYIKTPDKTNLVLISVGAGDLMYFEGLPHLSCPIIQSQGEAIRALAAVVAEMERRVGLEHTSQIEYAILPSIVVVIDEFPALFWGLDSKKKKLLSDTISALLQRGRHAKIHVVLAAQNPTVNQMRAEIGNITTRIAFRCAKKNYSEIILGEAGAENLLAEGNCS